MPLKLKITPRKMKASGLLGADGSMNCGTKARKNRATFGFRTLVRKPCVKTVRKGAAATVPKDCARAGRVRRSDSPT